MATLEPSFGLWATGTGVLRRLSPRARLAVGVGWLLTATASDTATPAGGAVGVGSLGLALLTAAPPARALVPRALFGVMLLAPVFLLAPWTTAELPPQVLPGIGPIATPWRIFTTGMAALLISLATMSTLSRSDLREALAHLPVPRLLGAIVLMVALQTESQLREVRRIRLAMRARGSPRSWLGQLGMLAAIPKSWLPRLHARAGRLGDAMQVRGHDGSPIALDEPRPHPWDLPAMALALGWLALGLAVRLRGAP